MQKDKNKDHLKPKIYTACIVFPDGRHLWGAGFGAEGIQVAELCFNTSMTGYQEILTDLSYAGQIINFTFPHIGNTGINAEDNESNSAAAQGMITRNVPTTPSHWKADSNLEVWLRENRIIGIGNIDTRKITRFIRQNGAKNIAICHSSSGNINLERLKELAKNAESIEGKELTAGVTCLRSFTWQKTKKIPIEDQHRINTNSQKIKIVAIDYGAKTAIFNQMSQLNRLIEVVPAHSSFETITNLKPDGIFLSNGPGDPKATFNLFGSVVRKLLLETKLPIFGICLGHQILGIASGANTIKMPHGHHGANHPVLDLKSGKVAITSMNHGFAIDKDSLPEHVIESHFSLFDKSNCGIEIAKRNSFSVQYHPEASPGPRDSYYLFEKFFNNIRSVKEENKRN